MGEHARLLRAGQRLSHLHHTAMECNTNACREMLRFAPCPAYIEQQLAAAAEALRQHTRLQRVLLARAARLNAVTDRLINELREAGDTPSQTIYRRRADMFALTNSVCDGYGW